jgi:hypothetical protein
VLGRRDLEPEIFQSRRRLRSGAAGVRRPHPAGTTETIVTINLGGSLALVPTASSSSLSLERR